MAFAIIAFAVLIVVLFCPHKYLLFILILSSGFELISMFYSIFTVKLYMVVLIGALIRIILSPNKSELQIKINKYILYTLILFISLIVISLLVSYWAINPMRHLIKLIQYLILFGIVFIVIIFSHKKNEILNVSIDGLKVSALIKETTTMINKNSKGLSVDKKTITKSFFIINRITSPN